MSRRRRALTETRRLRAVRRRVAWLGVGALGLMALVAWVMWGDGGYVAQVLVYVGVQALVGVVGWLGAWVAGEWPADSVPAILRYTAAAEVVIGGGGVAWRFWRELEGEEAARDTHIE